MKRTAKYTTITVCILLSLGVVLASENNLQNSTTVSSEHIFIFETKESNKSTERIEYSTDEDWIEMEGVVNVPTPCHGVDAEFSESKEGEYLLEIDSYEQNMSSLEEACVQAVDSRGFEANISANTPYTVEVVNHGSKMETIEVDEERSEIEGNRSTVSTVNEGFNSTEDQFQSTDEENNLNNYEVESTNQSETFETANQTGDSNSELNSRSENQERTQGQNDSNMENRSQNNSTDEQPLEELNETQEDQDLTFQETASSLIDFINSLIPR